MKMQEEDAKQDTKSWHLRPLNSPMKAYVLTYSLEYLLAYLITCWLTHTLIINFIYYNNRITINIILRM